MAARVTASAEAVEFVIRLNRDEATRLQDIIYRHGDSAAINAIGGRLRELLRVITWGEGGTP